MALCKMETFNSMKYFKLLKKSGLSEQQAQIHIEMVQEASQSGLEHLATKEDLHHLEQRMDTKINTLEKQVNTSKWQVLSSIVGLVLLTPMLQLASKHLGL